MTFARVVMLVVVCALLGLISGLAVGSHAMGILYPEEALVFSMPKRQALDPSRRTYLDLGQFVIPVVAQGKTRAFVLAEVTISLTTEEAKREAAGQIPTYRDAAIQSLYAYAGTGGFMDGDFDPKMLAEHMVGDLNTALGANLVDRVMFTRLMLQNNYRS